MRGWLGAYTPEGFIATAMADVRLPCHTAVDYDADDWEELAEAAPECTGNADFFANICKLSRDRERVKGHPNPDVFASPQEFLDHHIVKLTGKAKAT
jgi:hypothetical protein